MIEHPAARAALSALLETVTERVGEHALARSRYLPPAGPVRSDAAEWERHDAAVAALTELYLHILERLDA